MGDLSYEKFAQFDADPRLDLSAETLDEASRNAFPVVAGDAKRRDKGGLMLGAAIAIGLGVLTFTGLSRDIPDAPAAKPAPTIPIAAPTTEPSAAPEKPAPLPVGMPPPTPAQSAVLAAPPGIPASYQAAPTSPVMVYDTSVALDAAQSPSVPVTGGQPSGSTSTGLSENEAFGSRLGGVGVETASATRLADPANTITQGTLIPAILETAIDSDLPGYVRAVVSQDVRSFDGARILVPRSSRLIGQYKSGLSAGQTRAFVIWTRLIRPDGVSVALASPAVEYSGRSGLSGQVDNHFFKRFGSASLLSVIGGLGALATGGAAGLLISSNSQGAAAVAAQRDAQIPPTVRVQPGQPVRVFTARDLDFSSVAK